MISNSLSKPIQILLVDDHQSFLDGLKMLIGVSKSAMQVVGTANSRDEALKAAAEHKPDLILLDIDLGNDNGLEVLPELIEKTDAKVIMLTGVQDPQVHEKAILTGARGVLLKNSNGQIILKAIEKVFNGEIWANNDTLSKVLSQLHQKSGKKSYDPEQQKIDSLTAREREIISMMVTDDSSTNKEIAGELFISESTLKNHLTAIYSKLGVRNRIDLLKYALTHKLDKT